MRAGTIAVVLAICLSLSACGEKKIVVPEVFRVKFETSQGDIIVEATRSWAPHGVDRFHELVRMGYFTESRFFRVVPQFIAQFGVHRDYDVHRRLAHSLYRRRSAAAEESGGHAGVRAIRPEYARHGDVHQLEQ